MMKLSTVIPYLTKIHNIDKSRDTRINFCDISIFSPKVSNFCYIKKYKIVFKYIVANSFNFFKSIKVVLINMVAALVMPAKLVTLSVLKIKIF